MFQQSKYINIICIRIQSQVCVIQNISIKDKRHRCQQLKARSITIVKLMHILIIKKKNKD